MSAYRLINFYYFQAVKRLMQEAQELSQPTSEYFAQPVDDNLFEWHFSVRGPEDSDFDGGVYHGRIILPPEYPMKPPSIMLLTVRIIIYLITRVFLNLNFFLISQMDVLKSVEKSASVYRDTIRSHGFLLGLFVLLC